MFKRAALVLAVIPTLLLGGCSLNNTIPPLTSSQSAKTKDTLVLYSGRAEELISPLVDLFTRATGIKVDVRYAGTAELAAQILEEGTNSPADVFLAQDAGALGAVAKAGLFSQISTDLLSLVDQNYAAADGSWVGVSGRARSLVYNTDQVTALPTTVFDLAKPEWKGRIAIAPTNASFQAFVTAMRVVEGDDAAAAWLAAMKTNAVIFEKNGAILDAVDAGQVDAGLINHYYWFAKAKEVGVPNMNSKLASFEAKDLGNLVNVAGAGIINDNSASRAFMKFLLSKTAQTYFAEETSEYPLIKGIDVIEGLTPLSDVRTPEVDLSDLDTLDRTLELIRSAGLI